MGLQFENLVLNNRSTIKNLLHIKPEVVISDNPFYQRETTKYSGCQIDYLIQTKHKGLYVCEIKFSKDPIGKGIINKVLQKMRSLHPPKGFSCRPILIHVNGVTDEVKECGFFSEIIDFGQLLEEE